MLKIASLKKEVIRRVIKLRITEGTNTNKSDAQILIGEKIIKQSKFILKKDILIKDSSGYLTLENYVEKYGHKIYDDIYSIHSDSHEQKLIIHATEQVAEDYYARFQQYFEREVNDEYF